MLIKDILWKLWTEKNFAMARSCENVSALALPTGHRWLLDQLYPRLKLATRTDLSKIFGHVLTIATAKNQRSDKVLRSDIYGDLNGLKIKELCAFNLNWEQLVKNLIEI